MGSLDKTASTAGSRLQSIGSKLTAGLTLPIVAIGGMAVKAAIDFEKSFSGVGKTVDGVMTKGGKLTQFGEQLQQGFRDMAKTMPVSVNELNAIGEAAGSLGIQGKDILSFTQTMAMLGATTNLTSDEAATGIAQIQNQYQAAGVDTDKFASSLVALGNAGASTEKQILEFASRMGGAANQMGISQAEVLGWSNAMASVGINAELGSTAWNKVVSQMGVAADMGGEKIMKFAKVAGMSTVDFTALVKTDASEALNKVVAGFGRVKAEGGNLTQTMVDLGMKNSGVQMTFKNLAGASGMVSDSLKLGKQAWIDNTAATEEYGKKAGTTASQLQMLYNKGYDAAISLGQQLLPSMMKLIPVAESVLGFVVKMIQGFANLPAGVQTATIGFLGFLAALGPIVYIGGTAMNTISGIAGAAKLAGGSLSTMMSGGLSAAPLVAQIGLIGVALAGLAVGAYKVYGAITNIMAVKDVGGWKGVLAELGKNTRDPSLSLFQSGAVAGNGVQQSAGKGHDVNLGIDPAAMTATATAATTAGAAVTAAAEQTKEATKQARAEQEAYRKEIDKLSGREAISVAGLWMQKVTDVGGVTKLATADQIAFNTALGDAIEAMGRLNKSVDPKLMQAWMASFQGPAIRAGIPVTGVNADGSPSGMPGTDVGKPTPPMVPVPQLNVAALSSLPGVVAETLDQLHAAAAAASQVSIFSRAFGTAEQFGSQLSGVVMSALTGGGKIGESVGGMLGTDLLGGLAKSLSSKVGGLLGGIFSSVLPGLGGILGSLAGGLIDRLFGTKGRDSVVDFASSKGGFDALHAELNKLGAEGEKLWINLTQGTGRNNPEQAKANIDAINAALQNGPSGAGDMETQAGNAGYHTNADLQATAAQAQALYEYMASTGTYSAAQVQQAWEAANAALIAAGDQEAIAAQQTSAALSELDAKIKGLQESYANEAPEEVMGVVEARARAEVAALEKIFAAGVNVPINFMPGQLPNWGNTNPGQQTLPPGESPEPDPNGEVPELAAGGIVRSRTGGTIVRVGEGGRDEAVIPLSRGGGGGMGTTIIIEQDGRATAEWLVPHIPGVVQRLGLA